MVLDLVRHALFVALVVAGPLLVTELVVGVVVSVIQAVTSIQEQTLTFVPKLAAVALVLVLTLPWALHLLVQYLQQTLRSLPAAVP
jgi:flagellar biosynthetic protein FliQ